MHEMKKHRNRITVRLFHNRLPSDNRDHPKAHVPAARNSLI